MKQRFSTRTRLVSALLTLAMVFTFLPFSAFAATDSDDSGYVENTNTFPDDAFWSYLLKYVDKNRNGTLSQEERYAVTKIDVNNKNITSLKGIEFFPNLKKLVCYNNQLTSLDVSQNTALEYLDCDDNQLTELDVSQNPALKYLNCSHNRLTSLDVSENPALWNLNCDDNQLTKLDVSKNLALLDLYCDDNQLTSLDVSQNTNLAFLSCDNNKIDINIEETSRTFDLSTLPGFDVSKATNWKGGTVNGSILTVDDGATEVTYSYDCGREATREFSLQVLTITRIKQVNIKVNTPPKGQNAGQDRCYSGRWSRRL